MNENRRVLIIKAGNPEKLEEAEQKAVTTLENEEVNTKVIAVPSVVHVSTAMRAAIRSMELKTSDTRYIGYVVLGDITAQLAKQYGATKDYMAEQAVRSITSLTSHYSLAYGIGINTEGSSDDSQLKGEQAASDCLEMLKMKKFIGLN